MLNLTLAAGSLLAAALTTMATSTPTPTPNPVDPHHGTPTAPTAITTYQPQLFPSQSPSNQSPTYLSYPTTFPTTTTTTTTDNNYNNNDDNNFIPFDNTSTTDTTNNTNNNSNNTIINTTTNNNVYSSFLTISRYVVQRVLVPIVLVVGVVGNTVTIVVLTRRQMRSSTNNYLTALAISDLLYLVFTFTLSLRHHPGMDQPHHWVYWHYFRYALWLTDASSKYSTWQAYCFGVYTY
ncbi:hypothetical protein Pmani_038260 [Petrolisthes manimaculis]|uniref:G-protein coupled receptors family 1 profile domain-containing protein n=1 Tax=Petrolisthes manimaculis TaxID=1843537 RepID=A0AAE1NGK0_9EUCA|nr:hypothetical protein Pmani_038260 [Petrolisthes manimaculis]